MFVALLMTGCGGDTKKPGGDSPESNASLVETPPAKTAEVGGIDLDDNETRNRIIAEAIDSGKLQRRQSEEAIAYDTRRGWGFGTLAYAPNKQTPYSRWGKTMYYNRQIRMLSQFKDGRQTGLSRTWYENGQKESERTYKDGKVMTIVVWK